MRTHRNTNTETLEHMKPTTHLNHDRHDLRQDSLLTGLEEEIERMLARHYFIQIQMYGTQIIVAVV